MQSAREDRGKTRRMGGLYFVLPTIFAIVVSMLAVRAGAAALRLTGMEPERARFQALSAFTGTGFTTREAEAVLSQPLRRRIVSVLMILGHAGIVTVIVTATSSLVAAEGEGIALSAVALTGGLLFLYVVATRTGLATRWEGWIHRRIRTRMRFDQEPVEELMRIGSEFGLARAHVPRATSTPAIAIRDLGLLQQRVLILAIERESEFISSPSGAETVRPGDDLLLYGPAEAIGDAKLLAGWAATTEGRENHD